MVKASNKELSLMAMTMIEHTTGCFEIAHLLEANSYKTQKASIVIGWHDILAYGSRCGQQLTLQHHFTEQIANYGLKRRKLQRSIICKEMV